MKRGKTWNREGKWAKSDRENIGEGKQENWERKREEIKWKEGKLIYGRKMKEN